MLKRLPSRNRPTLTATQPSTQPRNLEVLKSETASRASTAPPTLSQKKQRQSRPPLAQPRHGGFLPSRRLGAPLTGVLHGSGSGYPGFKHVGMYVHTYLLLYIYIYTFNTHTERIQALQGLLIVSLGFHCLEFLGCPDAAGPAMIRSLRLAPSAVPRRSSRAAAFARKISWLASPRRCLRVSCVRDYN